MEVDVSLQNLSASLNTSSLQMLSGAAEWAFGPKDLRPLARRRNGTMLGGLQPRQAPGITAMAVTRGRPDVAGVPGIATGKSTRVQPARGIKLRLARAEQAAGTGPVTQLVAAADRLVANRAVRESRSTSARTGEI